MDRGSAMKGLPGNEIELEPEANLIAQSIRSAVRVCNLIDPVRFKTSNPSESLATTIRDLNIAHWLGEDRKIVGHKVGLTAKAIQAQFGVDGPAYGCLFADMIVEDGGTIEAHVVPQLWVEAELALVLNADIENPNPTSADILSAVDYGLPAIELANSRIRGWDLTLFDYLADNGAASHLVLGKTPIDVRACDVSSLKAATLKNGTQVSEGTGKAVLGSPLHSLMWLAQQKVADGKPLRKGEIVMTGAMGPIVTAGSGDEIVVHVGSATPVSVSVV